MLSGTHSAFGCFAPGFFAAVASAAPSCQADDGGIRFLRGFVRSWPLTALVAG